MAEDLEATLRRVAAGELTPEEALGLLRAESTSPEPEAAAGPRPEPGGPPEPAPPEPAPPEHAPAEIRLGESGEPITTVRLKTSYRAVEITVDPSVAQLVVTGEHAVATAGASLLITTSGPLDDGLNDLPRTFAWARAWREHGLQIRLSPALALELEVTGTDVKLHGCRAPLRAHLVASSLRGEDLSCALDVECSTSSLKLTASPKDESRIRSESSSVRLALPAEADLKITATNRMGRLALLDRPVSTFPLESEESHVVIGAGGHQLRLDAVMSSVTVSSR